MVSVSSFQFLNRLSFIVMLSYDHIRKLFHINPLHIYNANSPTYYNKKTTEYIKLIFILTIILSTSYFSSQYQNTAHIQKIIRLTYKYLIISYLC